MPVERRKSEPPRQTAAGAAGGSGNSNTAAAGKKRKKKKKEKSSETVSAGGAKISRGEEAGHSMKRNDSISRARPVLVLTGSSIQLKTSDRSQCSSSSSIENKPTTKVGRFDYSSSDAMSIGGQTSASSSTAMDVSTNGSMGAVEGPTRSTFPCDLSITRSASMPLSSGAASAKGARHLADHKPASGSSTDSSSELALESLRWEREYSDEEREKERIEVYKENRRKRYENALAERKAQLSLHTSSKVKYYC